MCQLYCIVFLNKVQCHVNFLELSLLSSAVSNSCEFSSYSRRLCLRNVFFQYFIFSLSTEIMPSKNLQIYSCKYDQIISIIG